MKTLSNYFTRQNTWRAITFIALTNLGILIAWPKFGYFLGACCVVMAIVIYKELKNPKL